MARTTSLMFAVLCAACFCRTNQLKLGSPTTIKATPDWDFLKFVSQWPESFCLLHNASHAQEHKNQKCIIPSKVKNWTIHGTWPTKVGVKGPTSCNDTWKFNLSEISDLMPKLNMMWPDFLDEKPGEFWSHEWESHGTCAASLPELYGEHRYFETTLQLKERFDLYSILSKRGIVPSFTTKYNYDDIIQAIKEGTGGISDIRCFHTIGSSGLHQYLAEVQLCLDKSFKPFDCPKPGLKGYGGSSHYSPCSRKTTIALPPINGSPTAVKATSDWDFLLFVNQWPESFCLFYNASHAQEHKNQKCIIPSQVKNWTIHGTWPTKIDTEGPTNCNNTWKFNLNEISDLVPKLNVMWPDFLDENPKFWSHEWEKHGTCAASLPALYGEHRYFETTLQLKERINLYSILSKRGIVPSFTTKYNYDDIIQAIKEGTGGISDIICFQTNGSSGLHQYLAEVRLCLDKSFKPFDCPKPRLKGYSNSADYSPCSRKTTIALPPIK